MVLPKKLNKRRRKNNVCQITKEKHLKKKKKSGGLEIVSLRLFFSQEWKLSWGSNLPHLGESSHLGYHVWVCVEDYKCLEKEKIDQASKAST